MKQNISRNRKLFRKEVGKVNARKVENCNKDKTGKVKGKKNDVKKTWKKYFEDLYNIDKEEKVSKCV